MSTCGGVRGPVLFLTNNANTEPMARWLEERGEAVLRWGKAISPKDVDEVSPSFVLSFNYRHIVPAETIASFPCPAANVHCSVLPWNRGASPNFFSWLDGTPKGVTVHELAAGLDKGGILLQSLIDMDARRETFRTSYDRLIEEATGLLQRNWLALREGLIVPVEQAMGGSYHSMAEVASIDAVFPVDWDANVGEWLVGYEMGKERKTD